MILRGLHRCSEIPYGFFFFFLLACGVQKIPDGPGRLAKTRISQKKLDFPRWALAVLFYGLSWISPVCEVVGRGFCSFLKNENLQDSYYTHCQSRRPNGAGIVSVLKKTLHSDVTLQHIFLFQFL
jgi:hypothetical protein